VQARTNNNENARKKLLILLLLFIINLCEESFSLKEKSDYLINFFVNVSLLEFTVMK
jgi:hypothetical protein